MKKAGKFFVGLILGVSMLLAGCGDSSSDNSAMLLLLNNSSSQNKPSSGTEDDSNKTEVAEGTVGSFPKALTDAQEIAKKLDEKNEKVILFYSRPDKNYSNWGLWLWPTGGDGSLGYDDTNGKFQVDDATGVAYMVLDESLLKTAKSCLAAIAANETLNFIIRTEGWVKDPDNDLAMDLPSGNKHFMVLSGDKTVYTISDNMKPAFSTACLEDMITIRAALSVKYGLSKTAGSSGFEMVADDGTKIDVVDSVNANAKNDRTKNFTDTVLLTLKETVDTSKNWSLKHKEFGSIPVSSKGIVGHALKDIVYSGTDLGLTIGTEDVTFKVWAPTASDVKLLVYATAADVGTYKAATVNAKASGEMTDKELKGNPVKDPIDMIKDGTTGVWSVTCPIESGIKYYKYMITSYGTVSYVCDLYAKAASADSIAAQITDINNDPAAIYEGTTDSSWGSKAGYYNPFGNSGRETKKYNDAVLYEMHIRDWSRAIVTDSTGKFLDIANAEDLLGYIKDLGVTHVQILPMFDYAQVNADKNYNWGYNPFHYNVPEGRYVTDGYEDGTQAVKEMRTMIAKFHEAGIAVNMDVVYNHTSSNGTGSLYDSTVPYYYYRMNKDGTYSNGSGCGNETDTEAPMFRKYMIDSLKHWMLDYHINGFRFDLMGLHSVEAMKEIYEELRKIDPNVMVYGEPWTGGDSLVQNGIDKSKIDDCAPSVDVNGVACFNDNIRNAIKGAEFGGFDFGQVQGNFADSAVLTKSMRGDADFTVLSARSINYVECHDNYTLYDKLIYSLNNKNDVYKKDAIVKFFIRKPTDEQIELVKKEEKLAAAFTILAQGTPFLNGGQEFCRTKRGNPDSYSADEKGGVKWTNEPGDYCIDTCNTIDFDRAKEFSDIVAVYKGLIALRKSSDAFTDAKKVVCGKQIDGIIKYIVTGSNETFEVLFNSSDKDWTILDSLKTGYTNAVDVSTGEIVESGVIPEAVPAKAFVILKK